VSNEPTDIWPRDTCLDWHAAPEAPAYRWEFTEDGRDFSANVPMRVLCNDPARLRRLALAGAGLAMLFEDAVRDDITRGELVTVLDAFSVPFPGFFLSYPPQ
jgi:DNA-binding transcriptional LysR family regulator